MSPTGPVSLTGRGAVVAMACVFGAGLLAASWLGWAVLAGVAFVAGSAAAVRYTRTADLLTVAVTQPLVFFCALVAVETVTASGNLLLSVAAGSALRLAGTAPWLIAGVLLSLVIAWRRGLPRCLRDLRTDLPPARQPPGASRPQAAPARPPGAPAWPPGAPARPAEPSSAGVPGAPGSADHRAIG